MAFAATWVALETITRRKLSQLEKDKRHNLTRVWALEQERSELLYKTGRLRGTESSPVVAGGLGVWAPQTQSTSSMDEQGPAVQHREPRSTPRAEPPRRDAGGNVVGGCAHDESLLYSTNAHSLASQPINPTVITL